VISDGRCALLRAQLYKLASYSSILISQLNMTSNTLGMVRMNFFARSRSTPTGVTFITVAGVQDQMCAAPCMGDCGRSLLAFVLPDCQGDKAAAVPSPKAFSDHTSSNTLIIESQRSSSCCTLVVFLKMSTQLGCEIP
jgi:hypothetical protein